MRLKDKISKNLLVKFNQLNEIVNSLRSDNEIYPDKINTLRVLEQTFDELKVIIIGQDPYHGVGEANGLAFSVNEGIKLPPSLKNIYKELQNEFNFDLDFKNGNLDKWFKQGVILLNSSLTVLKDNPGSHKKIGWIKLTDELIKELSEWNEHLVFILWGAHAIEKSKIIDSTKHLILQSSHPSPFSAHKGFFGNNHFIKANEYLNKHNKKIIDWKI